MTEKPKYPSWEQKNQTKAKAEKRKQLRGLGLIPVEVWIKPENKEAVKAFDERSTELSNWELL